MRYVDQMDIEGKRVLLRVDLNVPLDGGRVADDSRILAVLPTIRHILERNGRLIITSHLDRPGGKRVPGLSLRPVSERLSDILGKEVAFVEEVVGPDVSEAVGAMSPGSAIMLENLRFEPGEEKNDDALSKALASHADVYIDDAFANAHRSHASNVGVTKYLHDKGGGLLFKRELEMLEGALETPERAFVVVIGGAKVASKIGVLEHLSRRADRMLLGGTMALPFLKAGGAEVGNYALDERTIDQARSIMEGAGEDCIVLPVDFVVASGEGAAARVVSADDIEPDMQIGDIGPRTIEAFALEIENARTVVWNGPMGMFEMESFSRGTRSVAEAIARSPAFSLAGGGDTNRALDRYGLREEISYVSTGGGAFLEILAGRELPAVQALESTGGPERA
ncbi:MAG: phosphoglycerate kinase [Euryarchaeota archaeon]|nr:phosphoglycerate kinase [Euryarchaeota archaeon]